MEKKKAACGCSYTISQPKVSALTIPHKFSFVAFPTTEMNQARKNREKGRFPSRAKQTFPNKMLH